MKILLMNGHGGNPYDSGAVGNGYKEAELTRELADLVETKLEKYATVVRYPKDRNAYADVQNGTFANYVSGGIKNINYAFEIHFNAGGGTGTEIYITTKEEEHTVEDAIVKNIANAIGVRNRGVKVTDFSVIATCKYYGVSSALLETLFIDSASDMKLWASNKNAIAQAIVDGIATGFGLKATSTSKPSTNNKPSTSTASTYKLVKSCKVYNTASNAKNRKNAVTTYGAGTYYIFNKSSGMINVTKKKGTPGGWINPADNKTSSSGSSSSSTKYKENDTVTINGVYTSSSSTKKLVPSIKTGKITRVVEGANNPYLLNDGNIGWVNDKCIVSKSGSSSSSTSKKKSTSEIAKEVIDGKWGTGATRKKKLEAAGYNYETVQAEVNRQMGIDSTKKKVTSQVVDDVINGKYGNGDARKTALEKAGYDYEEVQAAVNKALS